MKQLTLSENRRTYLISELQKLFSQDFDMSLSDFRAGEIVDRLTQLIGPAVYNEAVQDVRDHFQRKLDDLEGEVFVSSPSTR